MKRNAPKRRIWSEARAQTTIELFMVLAVSFVALAIIYALYSTQVFAGLDLRDSSAAKGTVQRVVSAANFVYLAGPGSQMQVWVQMPDSADLWHSAIIGKTVSIRMLNGTDVLAVADMNILGRWSDTPGGYYMWLTYDGNNVIASYNPFEMNKEGIFVLMPQGKTVTDYFLIRNNTSSAQEFWIAKTFPDTNVVMGISPGYAHFFIAPNDIHRIDLNFTSSPSALGNYAGSLLITGKVGDLNYKNSMSVSAEVVLQSNQLTIYPKSTKLTGDDARCPVNATRSFVVCNSGDSAVSIDSWSKAGNGEAYLPVLPVIATVGAGSCTDFLLTFVVPGGSGNSLANIDLNVNYPFGRSYTANIQINKNGC